MQLNILYFHQLLLSCVPVQSKYSTCRVWPCWEQSTTCVGSSGIRDGACPSAGACTLGCVAASGAGPRTRHFSYRCWSGSPPEPWGLGGCLGGAPNTWMETDDVRCALQRKTEIWQALIGTGQSKGNIRRRLMISGSGWRSCTSPALPLLRRTRFACCPQQQQG